MSAHTPTPWFAINRGTTNEPMWSVMAARIAGQKPRHEVAICATGDSPQEMETANTAFIVRAVNAYDDLISMVKLFEKSIEYEIQIDDDDEGARMKVVTLHIVRDTLAKAES